MRARAFAKINLSLRVLGTRPDGYHELRTIFQSIALHDTLTIRHVAGPFRLTCDDASLPRDRTNLVWRAADRLWKAARRRGAPRGVAIHLTKCIPVQAGLGGGSSDAAAALRALAKVWRVDQQSVREAAVTLGADVPYFLEGGTVLGLERGDVLVPLPDHPRRWVVLVIPPFGVGTKEAYAWFDRDCRHQHFLLSRGAPDLSLRRGPTRGAVARRKRLATAQGCHAPMLSPVTRTDPRLGAAGAVGAELARPGSVNDLEAPVSKRHPEIRRIVSSLNRAGSTRAAMSGSGSAVFGLFETKGAAFDAAGALKRGNRSAIVTRTLTRAECRRLAAK